jgi:flagellar biosynthesis GTPase FlhF
MTQLRKPTRPFALRVLIAALGASTLLLSGCNQPSDPPADALQQALRDTQISAAPSADATAPAHAPSVALVHLPTPAAAYTPPSANQLYQMVAPIAVYPDKLIAQVLAASTFPQQISQANRWLARNESLHGGALADAADRQPWDPSVKSLVAFKPALDQLADNLPWTTALGEAYYNDPGDVMNAIQVMRQRAIRSGQLKNSNKLKVITDAVRPRYAPDPSVPVYYAGPTIVEPPPQLITIAPAQPDLVYVPTYDPQVIYGQPVRVYPGYIYSPPPPFQQQWPGYSGAQVATSGALGFGLGVVVGAALEKHDWGWHAWGVDWGRQDQRRSDDHRPRSDGAAPSAQRPTVVYNNQTYVSRSETVIHNEVHNVYNNTPAPRAQALDAGQAQQLYLAQQTAARQTQQVQVQQAQLEQQQAALKQQQAQQANQDQQAQLKRQDAQLQEQQGKLRQQQEGLRQQQLQQAKAQELSKAQDQATAQAQQQAKVQQQAKAQEQAKAQGLARAQEQATAQAQQQAKGQQQAKAQEQAKAQGLARAQEQATAQAQAKAKDEKAQRDKSHGSKDAAHQKEAGAAQAHASQEREPEQQVSTGSTPR